jgi:hypothetical protein
LAHPNLAGFHRHNPNSLIINKSCSIGDCHPLPEHRLFSLIACVVFAPSSTGRRERKVPNRSRGV